MNRMIQKAALGFLVTLVAFPAISMVFAEMRPLESAAFPVGTYVIPMDEKQNALKPDNVTVFGFIWAILNDSADIYRIIEPPDVVLKTATNPSGAVYSGGVILVNASYGSIIMEQKANFSTVVVDTLTEGFTSDNVLFINKPTKILVIRGQFGHTEVTLDWMKIPYMINSTDEVAANPTMLLDYDVVVDDCAGWAKTTGVPWNVWTNMSKLASNGGELIFTDIALMDLQLVFPGYVSVVYGNDNNWTDSASIHNPPLNFSAEYPSQYSATFPLTTKIHTMGHDYVVDQAWRPADVRVIMDTSVFNYTWSCCPYHPDPHYAI
jgi:hypothetical protein